MTLTLPILIIRTVTLAGKLNLFSKAFVAFKMNAKTTAAKDVVQFTIMQHINFLFPTPLMFYLSKII